MVPLDGNWLPYNSGYGAISYDIGIAASVTKCFRLFTNSAIKASLLPELKLNIVPNVENCHICAFDNIAIYGLYLL